MLLRRRSVLGLAVSLMGCGAAGGPVTIAETDMNGAGGEGGDMPLRMGAGMGFGGSAVAPAEDPQDLAASMVGTSDCLAEIQITPLGLARWALYFDFRDSSYDIYNHGDALSAALTPRVGAGTLTPTLSPTVASAGIGGGRAIDFNTTTNSYLDGPAYASIVDGTDKAVSVVARVRRVGNESGAICGWGRTSATDQYLWFGHAASGALQVIKDGASETLKTVTSTFAMGFTDQCVGFATNGSTVALYGNNAATNITASDLNTTDPAITQFRIGTTGMNTAGTDDLAGLEQAIAVSADVITLAEYQAVKAAWDNLDPPAIVGTDIIFEGTSITKAAAQRGLRGYFYDNLEAATSPVLNFNMVGPASDGNFPDNQHDGVNGSTIANIKARIAVNVGVGKLYPNAKLCFIEAGTNDFSDANGYVDNATVVAAWKDLVVTTLTAGIASQANFLCVVSPAPPIDLAYNTGPRSAAFAASFDAVCDEIDALFPSNPLFRWNFFLALGGVYDPDDYLPGDPVHPRSTGYDKAVNHTTYGLWKAQVAGGGTTLLSHLGTITT